MKDSVGVRGPEILNCLSIADLPGIFYTKLRTCFAKLTTHRTG